jgi:maltose alpha-D-glucosyltransferase / alpha-amylase
MWNKDFSNALLEGIARRRKFRGERGELVAWRTPAFHQLWGPRHPNLEPYRLQAEQRNSSIAYGDRFIMKMFRRLEAGTHPEVELGEFLLRHGGTEHAAVLAGGLEYRAPNEQPITLAVLHGFVPNEGLAYGLTVTSLSRFFEYTQLANKDESLLAESRHSLELASEDPPESLRNVIGDYLGRVGTLGQRTAEMHNVLSRDAFEPAFEREPFTDHYRRSIYHGLVSMTDRVFEQLRNRVGELPEGLAADAARLLERQVDVHKRFQSIDEQKVQAYRTRIHGDFHLTQVLDTGKDFVIIDFEGDATQHLSERRIKRSPLRDVAQMLNSFRYASYAALFGDVPGVVPTGDSEPLEAWARVWYRWVSAAFLRGYLEAADRGRYLPTSEAGLRVLLEAFMLQQALIELRAELIASPSRLKIPLQEILQLIGPGAAGNGKAE